MGWRIIYACAGQGIEAARVRRVRGLYSIGYITGRMDVEGAGGETDAATCGSRLGGSHLIFDLTLLHHFLSIFHFISVHPVISRSANKIKISLRHSQTSLRRASALSATSMVLGWPASNALVDISFLTTINRLPHLCPSAGPTLTQAFYQRRK